MLAILFDLEGTLVRSIENDQQAIDEFRAKTREKLVELGIPRSELAGIVHSTIMRINAQKHVKKHFNKEETERFHKEMDDFMKNYELRWAEDSIIFIDTLSTLKKLKKSNYKIGLVTNTSREAAEHNLSRHKIKEFIDAVTTREDVEKFKPDPEGINFTLEKLKAKTFIFVGDLAFDSQAARNAGGISVTINRNPTKRIKFQTDHVIESLMQIPDLIQQISEA